MAVLDYEKKEVNAKIVFYGPALSGKTTNIHFIYSKLIPDHRGELMTLSTKSHRTLFFDFLPVELGEVKGLNTRFFLYTVPGQIFYNNIRKQVLDRVDGIVFIADSHPKLKQENIQSYQNLEENLLEMGRSLKDIPHVIQYNKRDMPDVQGLEDLHRQINKYNAPFFEAVATKGTSVLKTLTTISKMVLKNLRETKEFQRKEDQGPGDAYGLSDDFISMTKEEAAKLMAQQEQQPTPTAQPAPAAAVVTEPAAPEPTVPEPNVPAPTTPAPAAQTTAVTPPEATAQTTDPGATRIGVSPPADPATTAATTKPAVPAAPVVKVPAAPTVVSPPVRKVEPAVMEKLVIKQWGNPQLVAANSLRLPITFKDPASGREYTSTVTIQVEPPILKK